MNHLSVQPPSHWASAAVALAATLLCQGAAYAQASPDDAQQQRRQTERDDASRQRLQPGASVHLPAPAADLPSRLPDKEVPCFPIREVAFKNAGLPVLAGLATSLAGPAGDDPPEGRCLGAQGVNLLLRRAQDAAIEQGLVTTRVLAEPQDLSSGRLQLTVVPGRLQAIRLTQESNERAGLAAALPLASGDLLNLRAVEQGLENLKRLPTVKADIRIEPGTQSGSSDLVVSWTQPRPWRASLSLDDGGTRATGRLQAGVTLSMDNLLMVNDLTYVSLNHDAQGLGGRSGTAGHAVHWSMPWGWTMMALNAGRSRYHQTVAGDPTSPTLIDVRQWVRW